MRFTTSNRVLAGAAVVLLTAGSLGQIRAEAPAPAPAPTPARGSAWLGVWLEDAVDGGVEIVAVVPGGPAELARLRPGDIILRANRMEIPIQEALRSVLARLSPGDPLDLQLLRSGTALEARVKLLARAPSSAPRRVVVPRPPASPKPPQLRWPASSGGLRRLGLSVADVTPALRTFYGAPEDAGVLVTRAAPEKPAGRAGIRVGDILVQLGERKLGSEDQLESSLDRWDTRLPLAAVVVRDGKPRTVTLMARAGAGTEVTDSSEQRKRERELLMRRLQRELDRLERRITEIRKELSDLREEP